jgi:hypothetical protein
LRFAVRSTVYAMFEKGELEHVRVSNAIRIVVDPVLNPKTHTRPMQAVFQAGRAWLASVLASRRIPRGFWVAFLVESALLRGLGAREPDAMTGPSRSVIKATSSDDYA